MPQRRHVVPTKSGWANKAAGSSRATSLHRTQKEAIDAARDSLKKTGGGELTIHRPNGQIRDSDTIAPGRDPFPPRDKR